MSESREKQERKSRQQNEKCVALLSQLGVEPETNNNYKVCFSEMKQCREELLLMAEKKPNPYYFYLFQKDPLANYPHKNKGQTNITNNIYFQ